MNKLKYYNLTESQKNTLFYQTKNIKTPFGKKNIVYADFIGSGQPCPIIENHMINNVYPFYANTHSNASNGILMRNKIENARKKIKQICNVDESYKLLFCGNGTTGCFNHLVSIIDYHLYDKIIIFVSTFEHYSNYLPWFELTKTNQNITLQIIPISSNNYLIDLDFFENKLNEFTSKLVSNSGSYSGNNSSSANTNDKQHNSSNLIICSVTACSNVTGSIMPLDKIKHILNKYNNVTNLTKLFFVDFACSAPYVKIDGSMFDGIVFSGHKFIGGIGTPGVMIAKEHLFNKTVPHDTGGGCVCKCTSNEIVYEKDIEKRESAGTPNIIGIIKLERAINMKNKLITIINNNELVICDIIKLKINEFTKKYPNFVSILSNHNDNSIKHVPIFAFSLKNVHYNFIVVLLNDLFGLQTRGGINCCGLLGEYVEKTFNVKGWCRVSLHWTMQNSTIINIFDNIEYVIKNYKKYEHMYIYNKEENLFFYKYI